ncbi:MAG: S4 domain-containing protein [Proteobacteria bacterium]|nr:S4 domain-containing protein [Pseudomonadota bacterium]
MGIRIDKWLWAARFFKTRARAKEAIDGGKVHLNGQRTKPAREVAIGDTLRIRQGWDEKIVVVSALSEQRRGAPEAQALYEETAESVARREQEASQRKMAGQQVRTEGRPTKRDRRMIHRFKEEGSS